MLDIVAPDEDQLPLTVETKRVDQAEARLAGPSARNAQPMGEYQSVEDRQDDECGDAARRQEPHLNDPIVCERKLIQPLHAQSNTPPPSARQPSLRFGFRALLRRAPEKRDRRRPRDWTDAPPALACPARANPSSACVTFITKCDAVENWGFHPHFRAGSAVRRRDFGRRPGSSRATASTRRVRVRQCPFGV